MSTENNEDGSQNQSGDNGGDRTFTQADVDRIVQERLERQSKNKFGDYEDLKAKAESAEALEKRINDLEETASRAERSALVAGIAAQFGISTKRGAKGEPSDADLFLTGADEATLKAQAERLSLSISDRKRSGNVAPGEGGNPDGDNSDPLRQFTRNLFKSESE